MTQQVTGAYLGGISEGRSFLKSNPNMTASEMRHCAINASMNLHRHNGAMADCFRGERDFWRNQLKKGA